MTIGKNVYLHGSNGDDKQRITNEKGIFAEPVHLAFSHVQQKKND
jgi:hypothetical protein